MPPVLCPVTTLPQTFCALITTYDLLVIDSAMRVGQQARLGIDTIVGGPPPPLVVDQHDQDSSTQPLETTSALQRLRERDARRCAGRHAVFYGAERCLSRRHHAPAVATS